MFISKPFLLFLQPYLGRLRSEYLFFLVLHYREYAAKRNFRSYEIEVLHLIKLY